MLSASLTCPNPDSVSNYPILTPDNNTFLIAENKTDQNTFITGLIQLSSAILNAGVPLTNTLVDNWVISNSSNISASTAWFLANNVRYGRVVTWLATNSANITNAASWIKNNSAEIANREITGTYSVGINVTDVNEYVEVTHNLNSTAPLVQVTDSTHQQVPVKITIINSNTIGVKADTQDVYNVTIIGGMVELSGGVGYSIDSTPYANWVIQNSSLVNTLAEKVETLSSTEFLEDNALTWVMQNSSKVNQAVSWFQILTAVRESHDAIEQSVLTWVANNSAAVTDLLLANLADFKTWVIQNSSSVDQSYDWYTNLSSEVSAATSWVLSNTANFEVVKLSLNDALNNSNDAISWIEDNQAKITETINWSDRSSAIDTKINTLSTTVNVLTGVAQGAIPVTAWWNSQRQLVDNVAAWVASTTSTWVSQIHIEAVELLFNPFKTWVEENSAVLMGLNGVNFSSNSTSTWIETNSSSLTDVDDLKSKFEDILALQQQVDDLRSVIVEFDDTHRWVSDKKQDIQQSVNNLITVTSTVSTANSTIQNITNNIADIKNVIESLNTSTDLNTTTTTAVQDWLTENSASIVAVNSWALQASTTLINLVESNEQSSKSQVDFSVLSGWFKQNTNKLDSLLGSDVATNAQISEINKQLTQIESSLQQIKDDEAITWVASNSANLLEIISQVVSTRDLTKNVNSWVVSKSAELANTLLTFNDITTKVATISDINGKVTSLITNVNGIELKLPIYDNLVSWVTSSSSTLKNTAETVNVLLRSKQITENTFASVQSSITNLTNVVNNTVVDVKNLTAWTVNVSSTIDTALNEANKLNVKLLETSNEIENLNTSNSTLIKDISFLRLSAAAENNKTKDALASHNLQIQELKDVSEKSIKDIDLLVVSKTSTDQGQTAISQRVEVLSKNVDTLTVNVENLVKNVSNSKLESQNTLTEIDSLKKSISNLLVNLADTPSSVSAVDTRDISTKVTTVTEGLNTLKTVVDSLLRERSNITSTKDSIANTIEELRSYFNNITGEQAKSLSALQSTVEGIDASTKNITTDIGTFNSTLINTISDVENIKQSLQDLQKTQSAVIELNQKVKTLSSNIPVLESKINELDSTTKETLTQTKSVAEKVTETTCVIEKAVGDIETLKSSDTKKSFDIVNVKNDVNSIKQSNITASVRLDNVENNTTNLTKTVTELEDQVLKSADISSIASADIANLKQQQSNVNETITKVIVETKNLKQDVISNTAVLQDTVKVISNNINSIIADVTLLKNTPATQSLSVESFDDSELNGNINTVKTAINSLLTDLNKLKESSQQIGNKLSEVESNTQLNLTVVDNRFKDTQANVDAVVSTVSKLETDITSTKLTTSSILDTLNKLKGVDIDTLNRVEAVKSVVTALTGRISEVETLISKINSAELTELHNQNEKLKIEVAGVKLTTIDIKDNLNKVSSDLAKTKIDLQDLKTQQDSNTPTNDTVLASTLDDVVKLKDDQQSTAAELVNLKGVLSAVDAKNKEATASIVKDLITVKDSTQNIVTDVNTLKENFNKLEEKAEQNNSSLSRIVTDLKATDIKISSDIKEIKNSVNNIPQIDLTDKISSIDNSISKIAQELDSTKNIQNTLSANLDTTSSNVGNIASELNTIKVLASKSNVDVIKLKELSDNLRKDINNINTLVDESFNTGKSTNNNTQGTISTLVTNLTTLQSKVDSINNDILKLKALNIKDSTQSIIADISNEPLNTNILNDIDELKKSLNLVQDSVNTLTASVEGNLKNIKVVLNETNNNTKKTTEKLVIDSITLLEGKIQNTIDSVATTVQTLTTSISELTIKCNRDISTLSKEVDDIKLKVRVSLDTIKADTNTSVTNAKIDINSSIEALKLETEASLDALRVNTETSIDDVKALVDTNKVEASALVETLRVNTKTSIDNLKTNITETIKSIAPSIDSVKIETENIKNTLSTLQVETHNSLESVKSNTNASINAVKSAVDDVKTSIVELKNNNSLKSIVITDNKDASELLNAVKADILTSIDVVKADTQGSIEAVKVDTKTAIDSVKAETVFIKSTLNTNKTDTQTSIENIKSSIDNVKVSTNTSIDIINESLKNINSSIDLVKSDTKNSIETVKTDTLNLIDNVKAETVFIKSTLNTVKNDTKHSFENVKASVETVKADTQTSIEDIKKSTQTSIEAVKSLIQTTTNASIESVKTTLEAVKTDTLSSVESVKAETKAIVLSLNTIKDDTKASIDTVKSSIDSVTASVEDIKSAANTSLVKFNTSLVNDVENLKSASAVNVSFVTKAYNTTTENTVSINLLKEKITAVIEDILAIKQAIANTTVTTSLPETITNVTTVSGDAVDLKPIILSVENLKAFNLKLNSDISTLRESNLKLSSKIDNTEKETLNQSQVLETLSVSNESVKKTLEDIKVLTSKSITDTSKLSIDNNKTSAELESVRSSIKLLTTNLNNIKSAIDYTDVIEKLKTANNNIESLVSKLQTSVNELNDKVEKLDKTNQLTNTAVAVIENNLNSLKQDVKDIKENTDAVKINTRIDLVVDQVSNNLVSNKQTTEKLDANIKVVELVSNKISSDVSVLKNKETATSTKLEELTNYTQTSLKDINNTLKSVNSISDKVDSLATKTADTANIVDVKVSTISNAITTLRTDIETVKKSVQEISTKYDELKKVTKEATSTLTVAQTPIVEDKNNCVLVDDKINTVIQTVNFLKDYTNKLTIDLLSVKTSNTKLATDLVTLKVINQTPTSNDNVVIDRLTQQVNTLNETVNSLADSSAITSTVQELSNKLQKLTNTLDLVRIDVSSSQNNAVLTKALQTRVNSVVENVDSSKELVIKLSIQVNKLDEQITDIFNTVKNALTRIEVLEANTSTHKDQISKHSSEIQAVNTAVSILARTSQVANAWVAANAENVNTALAKLNKIESITETIETLKSGVNSNSTSILNNTAWITSAGKSVETWISTASSKLNAIGTWIDSNNSIVPQKSNLAITAWFDTNSAALEQTLTWVAYLTTLEERSAVTAKISNNTETLYGLTSAEEWILANSNDTLQVVSWVMANSAGILNRTAAGNVALSLATTNNTWLTANSAVLQNTSSWTTQNSSITNTVRSLTTWLTANSSIVTNLNDAVQSVQNSLYNNTTWINSSAVRLNSTATWVNSNSSRILQGVALAESYHSDYDYSKQFIADNAQNILQWNSWLANNNQKLTQVATWVSILTAVREQHEWLEDAVFNWVQVNSASPLFTSNLDVTNWVVYNSADIAAVQAWYGSVKDNLDTYGRWVFEHLADLHSAVTWVNANSSQIQSTQSNVFKTLMYATSANEWINYNSDRLLNTTSWLTTNSSLIASSLKATDWFVKSNTDGPAALNWVISNSSYINDAAQWMHMLSGVTETHEHLEDQVFAWVQANSNITWVATWIQVNSALLFDVCTWVQSHSARFDDIDTFIDSNSSTIIGATVWTMSNSADILDADQWVFANRDNLDALYTHYAPISERVITAVDWVETNGIPVVNATNWVIKWNERVEAATEWVEQFSGVVENTVVWAAANSAHYDQAYAWVTTGSVEVRNLRSNVDYLLTATEPSIAWFERFRSMYYVVCANSGVDVAHGGSLWSTDTFGGDGGGDCAPCRWERNDGITVPVGMLEYGDVYKHEDGKGWTAIEILEKMLYGSRLKITQQPQSLIINPGTTITFETSATGTGTITYQWYFVPTGGTIDVVPSALNRILNVPNATYPQEGQYVAIVSNGITTLTSNFATLEVNKPVEITVDPISQKVYTPTGFTLYATLTGTLPISYRWYRNDVAISLPSSITTNNQRNISFGLNPSTTSLSGDYKLSASNIVNVDTSTAVITIIDPVVITLNPISRQLALYESITLTSAATGTEPITYQWYTLNGSASTIISGATTTSLIDITANGTYFMMASNDGGLRTARSANAVITHEALRNIGITLHPASSTINPNWYPLSAYTMSVAATGDAPITYQWYLSTIQDPLILIDGATSTQLTVTAGGTYFARASNDFSWAQSNLATIAVRIPPTITLNPLSLSAYDGDLVTFNANASGTETITYRWFRNNVSIPTNATGKNYTFTARVSDSGAQYHIVATGPFQLGSVSSTDATVDIKQHLAITQQPANIVTNPDQTVTFSVAATGTPTITYQWYFIQNGGTILQLLNGKVDVNNQLQHVTTSNEGQYVAVVTNGIETLTSNFVTLEINKPVEIVIDPLPQTIYVPNSFTLNAAVTGTYPIHYRWLRDTGAGYTPISNVTDLYAPTASAFSLTITNTTTALSGMYKVSAYNVVNTDESEALITIVAPVSVSIAPVTTTLHYGYGNQVILSATPAGTPPFTYQWYTLAGSVSTLIVGQEGTTHTTGNSGTYFVRISNAGGAQSAKSNNAVVNYDYPVKVTSISTNKSKVYTPNETFTVTGTITGSNVITYKWIRTTNGVSTTVDAISTTTGTAVSSFGSSKTITATTTTLSGTYTLSAYNSFSNDASAVDVAIIEPVGVTILPTVSTINPGEQVSIKTDVLSGTPPYTLQWYSVVNTVSTAISNATDTTYIANATGTYFVKASNDGGLKTAVSNNSVITMREALKITRITADQKVYKPGSFTLTADVTGSLPITYKWLKLADGITTEVKAASTITLDSQKNNIPYSITTTVTGDSGTYTISAVNTVNSDLSSTIVTVIDPVTITISPTLTTLHYGSGSTTVITAVTGGTPPVNVQWYSVVNTVSTAINGETGITYTTGNSGTYFAKASNDGGLKTAVSNNAVVTYDFPVKVTAISNSAPKVYTPNGTFTVTGTVTGSNAITYKWVRATNGTSTVLGTSSTTGTSVTSFDSSYTVLATNTNLSGVYTLSAYNSFSSDASTVNAVIIDPVYVTITPATQTITSGTSATISVLALTGTPPYTLQWYQSPNTLLTGVTSNSYTTSAAGTYFVVASNDGGAKTSQSNNAVIALSTANQTYKIFWGKFFNAGSPFSDALYLSGTGGTTGDDYVTKLNNTYISPAKYPTSTWPEKRFIVPTTGAPATGPTRIVAAKTTAQMCRAVLTDTTFASAFATREVYSKVVSDNTPFEMAFPDTRITAATGANAVWQYSWFTHAKAWVDAGTAVNAAPPQSERISLVNTIFPMVNWIFTPRYLPNNSENKLWSKFTDLSSNSVIPRDTNAGDPNSTPLIIYVDNQPIEYDMWLIPAADSPFSVMPTF